MFQIMHDFWVECFPMWQNTFEIGFYIMDLLTILLFFTFISCSFTLMSGGRRK